MKLFMNGEPMSGKSFTRYFAAFVLLYFSAHLSQACEMHTIPGLGRTGELRDGEGDQPVFFDFAFEQQNWETRSARDAHVLHHQGHHVHNKSHEEFYHFTLGVDPSDTLTFMAELPYVVRNSIE